MTADPLRWPLAAWYALVMLVGAARLLTKWRGSRWLRIRLALWLAAVIAAYATSSVYPDQPGNPGAAVVALPRNPWHYLVSAVAVAALCGMPRKHGWGAPGQETVRKGWRRS